MISGTRPARHLYKVKKFDHFGAINVPDFNLDAGISHPDQMADGAPYECTGYTQADILTDIVGKYFTPDFSYAVARKMSGMGPGDDGASFHAALEGTVAYGGILASQATITASTKGETFVSDINNWDVTLGRPYQQNGIRNVLGNGTAFNSAISAAYQGGISISVGSPWFNEWHNFSNPALPVPEITGDYPSWHNYTLKGKESTKTWGIPTPYAILKPWIGLQGDNGFLYINEEGFNRALSVQGSGALTIDKNANHWMSLIAILVERFPALASSVPALLKLHV